MITTYLWLGTKNYFPMRQTKLRFAFINELVGKPLEIRTCQKFDNANKCYYNPYLKLKKQDYPEICEVILHCCTETKSIENLSAIA